MSIRCKIILDLIHLEHVYKEAGAFAPASFLLGCNAMDDIFRLKELDIFAVVKVWFVNLEFH